MTFIDKVIPKVIGRNLESTPADIITEQMQEMRPLPMGRAEFEEWSDRIIAGAMLPGGESDPELFRQSQKGCLAYLLMGIGQTESHKPDAYFIHGLRVNAIKQIALSVDQEIREAGKKRLAEKEDAEKRARAALSGSATSRDSAHEGNGAPSSSDVNALGTDEV